MNDVAVLVDDVLPVIFVYAQDAELLEHLHEVVRKTLQLFDAAVSQDAPILKQFVDLLQVIQHFELFDKVYTPQLPQLLLGTLVELLVL